MFFSGFLSYCEYFNFDFEYSSKSGIISYYKSALVIDDDQYMWDLVCPQSLFIKVKIVTAAVQLLCVVSYIQQTKN